VPVGTITTTEMREVLDHRQGDTNLSGANGEASVYVTGSFVHDVKWVAKHREERGAVSGEESGSPLH
jgi:hypothetical protein